MIVDSHQHFWDLDEVEYAWLGPEHGPIHRTFTPDELRPQLAAAGVDRSVLVQSANSTADTESMLRLAAAHDWIGAVVGWVPLERPADAAMALDTRLLTDPKFKGVRHLNHDEPDPDWLIRPDVLDGLRVLEERSLVFEVVPAYPMHLCHVPTLARACPDLVIVIDHLAKPPIRAGGLDGWKTDLRSAAEYPNVHAKVSGLNTVADWHTWTAVDLIEPVAFALEVFGADRLMYGSDWPVATLAGDYAKVWKETNRVLEALGVNARDHAAIVGQNAANLYAIGQPDPAAVVGAREP